MLLGGAAGAFAGPELLDLPLTFEGTRAAGVTLGSGVVMVLDDTVRSCRSCSASPPSSATSRAASACPAGSAPCARRRRSCGWPTDVRGGSVDDEIALLDEIGRGMRDASICGLGQTAASAIESAIRTLRPFAGAGAA